MDAVTPILLERARTPEGLRRMVVLSLMAHGVLTVGILLMPKPAAQDTTREVMTISLGGTVGEKREGQTPIAGMTKEALPPTETAKPQPVAPPAPKAPEMVLPKETKAPPKVTPKHAPEDAKGR